MVYLSANGEVIGQFEERDLPSSLAAGQVPPDSFFWREGMPEWRPLRELVLPPRPARAQPVPERPAPSRSSTEPGQEAAPPAAERAAPRPITPAIAQKKPFVPRPAVADSRPAPSPQASVPARNAPMPKPEAPAKPAAFWKRLFRRSSGESPKPAAAPAAATLAQPAPAARLDSSAPPKPEAASPAPAAAAVPAADPVPLSPARNVGPSAASSAGRSAKRIIIAPGKQSTHRPGEGEAPSLTLPAKPSPTPGKEFPPQMRQSPPVARAPQSLASGTSSSGEPSATAAPETSGKKDVPAVPPQEKSKTPSQGVTRPPVDAEAVGGLPAPSASSPAQGQASSVTHGQTAAPAPKPSLPPRRQTVAAAPAPETVAVRPVHRAPSAAAETAPPPKTADRAPAARPTGKPSEPAGGPELMLAAAKSRGRGGRKGLVAALSLLLLAALGGAAWWFFPAQPPALRGEVRLAADDGSATAAAGADVFLVSREELAARWRDQLAEAQSRGAEVEELLKQANAVHREKVLALELASRTSELADEYNMPDAAELRAARDAAQAEEATALAEVEKLRREKESFASAAALLQAPPDALDRTQTDQAGAFALPLPASTEGLVVFVLAGADGENPSEAYGWLVPLAGAGEATKPALLSPANALDAEQIREIAGSRPLDAP